MKKLIISPHPDDAEYSTSATVLKNSDVEYTILLLSSGGDNDITTSRDRIGESIAFWKKIPNASLIVCDEIRTIGLTEEWKIVSIIDDVLENDDYSAVYVPPLNDNHFEHRIVSECARASLRGKRISLIEYYTPSTRSIWTPNYFVDVTNEFETKYRLLQSFESQLHRNYFDRYNIEIFHEDYFCRLRGIEKVEKYRKEFYFS